MKRLAEENRQLRIELGQAMYKVQQLGKLREQAAESQRKELLARQKEAKAIKELDLAKDYCGKRDSFARNEKAELLQQIKRLEDTLASISGREDGMREELTEATFFRQEAARQVEDVQKDIEKWKQEAIDQAKQVKQLEHKVQQLEAKRQQDKTRLKELAAAVRGQQQAQGHENENVEHTEGYEAAMQKPGSGKRSGSKPPLKKGGDAAVGKPVFEDPIKPVANVNVDADFILPAETSWLSWVGPRTNATWQHTLRPLLLRAANRLGLTTALSLHRYV